MVAGGANLKAGSGVRHGPYVAVSSLSGSAGAGKVRPSRVVVPSGKIHDSSKGTRISPIRCRWPSIRKPPKTSSPRTTPSPSSTSTLNASAE